jgi:phosphatidylglycerol lysyltransferase
MPLLAVLGAVMVLSSGLAVPYGVPIASCVLLVAVLLVLASLWPPRWMWRFRLPPLRAQIALLALAALDTAAAGLVFYVLLPDQTLMLTLTPTPAPAMTPALVYTVFLLAIGAGLVGATPGGIGPFEMLCLTFLPHLPEAPLLAPILGFRLVYYALPAAIALGVLLAAPVIPHKRRAAPARLMDKASLHPAGVAALCYNAPRAEAGLIRQGAFHALVPAQGRASALVAPVGQSLIMLGDPLHDKADPGEILRHLSEAAHQRVLVPCLYKCSARFALQARAAGWSVMKIGQDAIVDTNRFDLDSPSSRQLRRHLRKAEGAGVKIRTTHGFLPLAEMAAIAADWAQVQASERGTARASERGTARASERGTARASERGNARASERGNARASERGNARASERGSARGYSMGRFAPDYVCGQRTYLAFLDRQMVGFVTLHESAGEQALDLMCQSRDAPAGTMHLLIAHAIAQAAEMGCPRLSLAAVPHLSQHIRWQHLSAMVERKTGAAGHARFKSMFAPRWHPLYLAAPNRAALALAGLDLSDQISRPRPLFPPNTPDHS